MLFPEASKKVINAYLNQDEILQIGMSKISKNHILMKLFQVGLACAMLALHLLGYCELEERGPLPVCPTNKVDHIKK